MSIHQRKLYHEGTPKHQRRNVSDGWGLYREPAFEAVVAHQVGHNALFRIATWFVRGAEKAFDQIDSFDCAVDFAVSCRT